MWKLTKKKRKPMAAWLALNNHEIRKLEGEKS